ncbi:DUF453-domain-containing protein [Neofusicoccum parvum]|nr:DUF453-domain-containing protein [Neofusicoccum parvum]
MAALRLLSRNTTPICTGTRLFHQSALLLKPQNRLPAAYYRGGTSRAVMFRQEDLPVDRKAWDDIFRSVIGSPDPNGRQLDGMGGGVSSLSKVCVVGPSSRSDADVDYTFVSIGVKDSEVDFSSNCGNMTSAVGPFAIDSGLVQPIETGHAVVRIHNTNTGKVIHAKFCVEGSEASSSGDFAIDGVAGTAAKIQLAFLDPSGSKTGMLLPTGKVTDVFDGIEATCIDVGNPCVFVQASDLGVEGTILSDSIEAHPTLLKRLDSIRRQAGVAMKLAAHVDSVPGSIPKIAMVSASQPHKILSGQHFSEQDCDLVVRAISVGQAHGAVPITVAMALAASAKTKGSTVQRNISSNPVDPDGITLGHNSGKILVSANFDKDGNVMDATVFRTARRLMEGTIFWKERPLSR